MQDFMIIIREDLENLANMSSEQQEAEIHSVTQWVEVLAKKGVFTGGQPLEVSGKVVRRGLTTDGAFVEVKEGVSGYLLVKANSLEEAAGYLHDYPLLERGDILEVRPLMQLPE